MGIIIAIEDYRKRYCLEALLAEIGLPAYCEECGPDFAMDDAPASTTAPRTPATILPFPAPEATRRPAKKRATRSRQ